jgi:monofunctional biosynthetic peptidoglycan transglycosylase
MRAFGQRAYLDAVRPRLLRLVVRVFIAALALPWLLILPLNIIDPPTTAMMLRRTIQRWAADQAPAYPARDAVARARISPYLRRAVLAAEDDRFYLHWGFDFVQINKALDQRAAGGRLRGASTITQQVAKNIFLWEGRSFVRKGLEAYLTIVLEVCLSKERILDIYLNLAEWGDGVFGAEEASRFHFGLRASELGPDHAARLAAILPSPRRWLPHGQWATYRAVMILGAMERPAPRP